MPKVAELMSRNIANTLTNAQTWGGVIYNVKAYGAKGDGGTDDTAAVQNVINEAAKNGGIIYFPPGTYMISDSLEIPNNAMPIKMTGAGRASVLRLSADVDLLTFEPLQSGNTLTHHEISNLTFDGASVDGTSSLLKITCTSVLVVDHCFFFDFPKSGYGIYVDGNPNSNNTSHDIVIANSYFDTDFGIAGIYLTNLAADAQIYGNTMQLRFGCNYCIYINNSGSLQVFDNHLYNAKTNIIRIVGAERKTYIFDNNFLDNCDSGDLVYIDGTVNAVYNGGITFTNSIFMLMPSGCSGICFESNVNDIRIESCIFRDPKAGASSAIRVDGSSVDRIYIENNSFFGTYANDAIENVTGANCVIQNNYGYRKSVTGASWLSLNDWCSFNEQCAGLLYLSLYTNDSSDGNIILHYREGTTGTDHTIFTGSVPAATDSSNPQLIVIPVSNYANIRIDAASNVAIARKIFIPFNT